MLTILLCAHSAEEVTAQYYVGDTSSVLILEKPWPQVTGEANWAALRGKERKSPVERKVMYFHVSLSPLPLNCELLRTGPSQVCSFLYLQSPAEWLL